jgi:hypothetical protein
MQSTVAEIASWRQQIENLRYGRLQVCATSSALPCSASHRPRSMAVVCGRVPLPLRLMPVQRRSSGRLATRQIFFVQELHPLQVLSQSFLERARQYSHPVLEL